MKRILVAVDGSEPALRAVQRASAVAVALGAELTVAHVQIPLASFGKNWDSDEMEVVRQEERRWAERVVAFGADEARRAGARVSTVILLGSPAEAIAQHAWDHDFDLVVVGSSGRGAISRILLGSVSFRLVHTCKSPVMVVP